MKAPIRVAVVGVGQMGANHARVYSQLKDVELVAVVDEEGGRAEGIATRHGCAVKADSSQLIGLVDAVSIAVPSSMHAKVARPLLEAGVGCLVEKPLATQRIDAEILNEAAEAAGAVLMVGHIERFNPAVEQLRHILRDDHEIVAIEARRMSSVSARIVDVDVVLDLMVHDIDVVLHLLGEVPSDVTARGVSRGGGTDYAVAVLRFPSGAIASITASRVTQNQVRELHVTTPERFFSVDYSAQELLIFRQGRIGGIGGAAPGADGRYVLDVNTERVFVRRTEPLVNELSHFVEAVRGDAVPAVTGSAALAALEIAWMVQEQIRDSGHD